MQADEKKNVYLLAARLFVCLCFFLLLKVRLEVGS